MHEIDILGVPVTCFTLYREAVAHVVDRVKTRDKSCCVAINPLKVWSAVKDPSFAEVLKAADVHICDGIGVALAVRLLRGRSIQRITGVQLFFHLVAAAEKEGLSIFLLGATAESNEDACHNLLKRHPRLKIAGRHDGYFDGDEAMMDAINAVEPDILFVAMGSPKQEYWMAKNCAGLRAPFVMGVGGTFDVVSGSAKWAPALFRKTGTEFVYRLCMQPRRLKIVPTLCRFTVAVIKAYIHLRLSDGESGNGEGAQPDASDSPGRMD